MGHEASRGALRVGHFLDAGGTLTLELPGIKGQGAWVVKQAVTQPCVAAAAAVFVRVDPNSQRLWIQCCCVRDHPPAMTEVCAAQELFWLLLLLLGSSVYLDL